MSSETPPPESCEVQENQETVLVEPEQQAETTEAVATEPSSQEASLPLPTAQAQSPQPASNKPQSEAQPPVGETRVLSAAESSIRVDVGLLDKLMNMVGELVLTRNQINQGLSGSEDSSLLTESQRLSLITTELQEGIMKTRMQQIGNIWSKFPRVVRDLAMSCGKEIWIEMEGKETELDKTLIEAIKPTFRTS